MARKKGLTEFDILELYVNEMESQGANRNLVQRDYPLEVVPELIRV
jgi:hypothetical protein